MACLWIYGSIVLCVNYYLFKCSNKTKKCIRPIVYSINYWSFYGSNNIIHFIKSWNSKCKTPTISKNKVMKITFFVFFVLYLSLLLTFTLFDPMFGRNGHINFILSDRVLLKNYLTNSFNIIPFATIFEYIRALLTQSMNFSTIVTNLLGNLVALTPMALFLPMFIQKCEKFKYFVLSTSVTVIVIELLQLIFVTGSCDIDDLILNVFGACIAFIILKAKPIKRIINILISSDEQKI